MKPEYYLAMMRSGSGRVGRASRDGALALERGASSSPTAPKASNVIRVNFGKKRVVRNLK